MLVNYKVKNFLSYYKERNFSMIAGKAKSHTSHLYMSEKLSLLKGGLIYGANAAGKSNLVKSIAFAKKCILDGISKANTIEKHYKLNKNSSNEASQFEFEILIDDIVYAYGFSLMLKTKTVMEEWLYKVGEKEDKLIFSREKGKEIVQDINVNKEDNIKLEVYIDDLEDNKLLLEVLGNKKWDSQEYSFLKVLDWFENNLTIIFPYTDNLVTEYFEETNNLKKYTQAFDIGIEDIKFKPRDFKEIPLPKELKDKISNDISSVVSEENEKAKVMMRLGDMFLSLYLKDNTLKAKEIVFEHEGNKKAVFKFSEESDGTKRLLELIPLLEKVKCKNQTIFIDELERSLHPNLVTEFLNILYTNMEKSNSQFIIATHESRLLDLNRMRRDEIWFTKRNIDEGSEIYSLEEYKTRFDTKIDKAYLLGRYGGVPEINKLIDLETECDA